MIVCVLRPRVGAGAQLYLGRMREIWSLRDEGCLPSVRMSMGNKGTGLIYQWAFLLRLLTARGC